MPVRLGVIFVLPKAGRCTSILLNSFTTASSFLILQGIRTLFVTALRFQSRARFPKFGKTVNDNEAFQLFQIDGIQVNNLLVVAAVFMKVILSVRDLSYTHSQSLRLLFVVVTVELQNRNIKAERNKNN